MISERERRERKTLEALLKTLRIRKDPATLRPLANITLTRGHFRIVLLALSTRWWGGDPGAISGIV
jgi:hypothetical protein